MKFGIRLLKKWNYNIYFVKIYVYTLSDTLVMSGLRTFFELSDIKN